MPLSTFSFEPTAGRLLARFGLFVLFFGCIAATAHFSLGICARQGRIASQIDKLERLAAYADSPKAVFIGGSNLHYGLDSPRVEKILERPVINMGLQGSLGVDFWFRSVEPYLREGDWLILSVEPASLCGRAPPSGQSVLHALAGIMPAVYGSFDRRQWWGAIKYAGPALQRNAQAAAGSALRALGGRSQLRARNNAWGDFEGHKGRESVFAGVAAPPCDTLSPEFVSSYEAHRSRIETRGARVMLAIAPTAESMFSHDLTEVIEEAMLTFEALDVPFRLPDASFYDTAHHLLYPERTQHSDALASALQRRMNLPPPTP